LLERDAESSYLAGDDGEAGPMDQLLGHSITYRIAVGRVAGFSLHAGVAAKAQ
jgi:hypothetical protein